MSTAVLEQALARMAWSHYRPEDKAHRKTFGLIRWAKTHNSVFKQLNCDFIKVYMCKLEKKIIMSKLYLLIRSIKDFVLQMIKIGIL